MGQGDKQACSPFPFTNSAKNKTQFIGVEGPFIQGCPTGIRIAIKLDMIEKLTNYGLTGNLDQKVTVPSTFSGAASPFHNILNNEMNASASLEKMVVDFLIKTIESILSKADQTDQWSSFSGIPFLGEGSFQPHPILKNPLSETGPGVSAGKPKGQEIDEIIQGAADQYGVEPSLIKAVISVESNGNPQAVSPAGAQGLMQLMPKTAAELGVTDP